MKTNDLTEARISEILFDFFENEKNKYGCIIQKGSMYEVRFSNSVMYMSGEALREFDKAIKEEVKLQRHIFEYKDKPDAIKQVAIENAPPYIKLDISMFKKAIKEQRKLNCIN